MRDETARRAGESWENDRLLDARKLFDKLRKRPEIVQLQLRQTKQGCEVLIEAWECLAAEIRHQDGKPPDAQWTKILDLLGKRIDQRFVCTWEKILGDEIENVEAWIDRQIADLKQEMADYLNDRDDRAKTDMMTGVLPQKSPEMKRLKISENQAIRRMRWFWSELRRLQSQNGSGEYNRHLFQAPKPTYSPLPSGPIEEEKETNPNQPDGLTIHPKHIQTPQRELLDDFLNWYKKAQINGQDPQRLPSGDDFDPR